MSGKENLLVKEACKVVKNNEVNPTWQTKSMTVKEVFYKGFRSKCGLLLLLFNFKSCIDSTPEHFLYLVMGKSSLSLFCYDRFRGHSEQ